MTLSDLYPIFRQCGTVTTDSRKCPDGSLFFALKGESFNGNAFAAQALENGCAYAVIDEPRFLVPSDPRYLLADNCLTTLQQLARHHRRLLGTRVIGITGTNGKTTTKELIAAVLSTSFRVLYTEGNLNNHIGVPLTLLRLTDEHQIAIIEMGANHPGEIDFLCRISDPDYGIITNVGKAHLEGFGSFEGVIRTKGELYDYLREKGNCTVFIHHDNPYLTGMAHDLSLIPYGTGDALYINGQLQGQSPFLTFTWKAGQTGTPSTVSTRLIGDYNLPNALAAVTAGHYFGVETSKINKALEQYTPQNNRSQLKRTERNMLIVDAYNANPTSMMAALQNFERMEAGHKMLLLGEMRELGTDSLDEHRKIVDYIGRCGFSDVWLVGEQFAATEHAYRQFADAEEVIRELSLHRLQGRTILIKGSNGTRLYTVTDYL